MTRIQLLETTSMITELLEELIYLSLAIVDPETFLNIPKKPVQQSISLQKQIKKDKVTLVNREYNDETKEKKNAMITNW